MPQGGGAGAVGALGIPFDDHGRNCTGVRMVDPPGESIRFRLETLPGGRSTASSFPRSILSRESFRRLFTRTSRMATLLPRYARRHEGQSSSNNAYSLVCKPRRWGARCAIRVCSSLLSPLSWALAPNLASGSVWGLSPCTWAELSWLGLALSYPAPEGFRRSAGAS